MIADFDPYRNFPAVADRRQFRELIASDPAFRHLGLDDDRYVRARVSGNLITSLHRKIGDMYEEVFQYLLVSTFGLSEEELRFSVDVTIGNRIQRRSTDGVVTTHHLVAKNIDVARLLPTCSENWKASSGLGFEVRSCYQIGDSKRIQADYDMALRLQSLGYVPVMLIFCLSSLRNPIARLSRTWNLLQGETAFLFVRNLTGFDLDCFLGRHSDQFKSIMSAVFANF